MLNLQTLSPSLSPNAYLKSTPISDLEDDCGTLALDSSSSNESKKEASPFQTTGTASTSVTSLADLSLEAEDEAARAKQLKLRSSAKSASISYFGESQYEYLSFIEPMPVTPPAYDTLAPGGCPKYPILDYPVQKEKLPEYTPAVYKLTLCSKKQECISPFESSPSRSWRTVIVELNSTQLNFYSVPSNFDFTPYMLGNDDSLDLSSIDSNYCSSVTTDLDKRCLKLCEEHGFFAHSISGSPVDDNDKIIRTSKSSTDIRQRHLLRTYSLQHAKIGLASDYQKKPNVLRLRVEHEQFLLEFRNSSDLISWNLGLSIGRDISLDISEREAPKYRTVPRRRRNTINTNTPFFHEVVARRKRAQSDSSFASSSSKLRDKFSRFRNRLSSASSSSTLSQNSLPSMHSISQNLVFNRENSLSASFTRSRSSSRSNIDYDRVRASFSFTPDDEDSSNVETPFSQIYTPYDEDGDDDMPDPNDAARSEDDDDCDPDIDELGAIDRPFVPSSSIQKEDVKWNPESKQESAKRFVRNGLKCIRPLNFEDSWVNKSIVKPTTLTPLTAAYLRCLYFECSDHFDSPPASSASSCKSHIQLSDQALALQFGRKSHSDHFSLPDNSLARIPHHNLKEYIVGPHSLVPKHV